MKNVNSRDCVVAFYKAGTPVAEIPDGIVTTFRKEISALKWMREVNGTVLLYTAKDWFSSQYLLDDVWAIRSRTEPAFNEYGEVAP